MKERHIRELLNLLGIERFVLADIGARGGADKRWGILGQSLSVIGFEPDEKSHSQLSQADNTAGNIYYNRCVSEKPSRLNFYTLNKRDTSSCLKPYYNFLRRFPRSERFDIVEETSFDADSLDNILKGKKIDFIKIDAQGFGLNILKGAANTLRNACGIEIEAEFQQLYENEALFSNIDIYLRQGGFSLFDLRPGYWKRTTGSSCGRGQIIFADALYMRDYIMLDSLPLNIGAPVAAAIVYRKYDFATELLNFFCKKDRLSDKVRKCATELIAMLSKPYPAIADFKGRQRVIALLERAVDAFKAADWSRYDPWR